MAVSRRVRGGWMAVRTSLPAAHRVKILRRIA
jgi:hypothetical protein